MVLNIRLKKIFTLVFSIFLILFVFYLFNFILSATSCRKWYGAPQQETGAIIEGEYDNDILYMSVINSRFCLVSLDENKDPVFPDTSLRLKIGFFDRGWRLHTYNARVGGQLTDGEIIKIPMCIIQKNGQQKCSLYSVRETKEMLKGKKFIKADLVYKDKAPWENAKLIKKYEENFINLKNALLDHDHYPKISNKNSDFVIQLWQIEI